MAEEAICGICEVAKREETAASWFVITVTLDRHNQEVISVKPWNEYDARQDRNRSACGKEHAALLLQKRLLDGEFR